MKISNLKDQAYSQIAQFKQAKTVGQLRYHTRELQRVLHQLEKDLKR